MKQRPYVWIIDDCFFIPLTMIFEKNGTRAAIYDRKPHDDHENIFSFFSFFSFLFRYFFFQSLFRWNLLNNQVLNQTKQILIIDELNNQKMLSKKTIQNSIKSIIKHHHHQNKIENIIGQWTTLFSFCFLLYSENEWSSRIKVQGYTIQKSLMIMIIEHRHHYCRKWWSEKTQKTKQRMADWQFLNRTKFDSDNNGNCNVIDQHPAIIIFFFFVGDNHFVVVSMAIF